MRNAACGAVLLALVAGDASAQERGRVDDLGYNGDLGYDGLTIDFPDVLFLTQSAGFVHDVVKRPDPATLSIAEACLSEAARGRFDLECTQDSAAIERANLERFEAVVFYTTGELPISAAGKQALMDWLAAGGAFVGIHCATDTLYEYAPYVAMIGGTFDGHPWHEDVRVRVEDIDHPATDHLGDAFPIADEIYQFKNFRRHPVRVLLALDPASVDVALGARADQDYALAWTRDWGEGRVFYTALGHRAEVWRDGRFLEHLLDGIAWAIDGPDLPDPAPSGAFVMIGGDDRATCRQRDGKAFSWTSVPADTAWEPGAVEVAPGTGDLVSRAAFSDALVHVEFRIPSMPEAAGQARGNSGIYLHGRYEIQVLDSHGLPELGPGDCGAIYGKRVPDVNACRPPLAWQSYDVEFRAPRFDAAGVKTANARVRVWLNGRSLHDDVEIDGPTTGGEGAEAPSGPLVLQDHGDPVRYRNVWWIAR